MKSGRVIRTPREGVKNDPDRFKGREIGTTGKSKRPGKPLKPAAPGVRFTATVGTRVMPYLRRRARRPFRGPDRDEPRSDRECRPGRLPGRGDDARGSCPGLHTVDPGGPGRGSAGSGRSPPPGRSRVPVRSRSAGRARGPGRSHPGGRARAGGPCPAGRAPRAGAAAVPGAGGRRPGDAGDALELPRALEVEPGDVQGEVLLVAARGARQ